MICEPCRPPHQPEDCIDSKAGREYPWRHCCCQHQPRPDKTTQSRTDGEQPGELVDKHAAFSEEEEGDEHARHNR